MDQVTAPVDGSALIDMSPSPASEAVLQHFEFPLQAFVTANAAFDPAQLVEVRFQFERSTSGVVVLDDLGFRISD